MSFLAREVKDYPLTIKDLTSWVLTHVVFPILPDVKTNTVIWGGVPGLGKTPLANALANTVSSYLLNELGMPGTHGFKTANDIDFFRSEPGRVHTPVIFDDGEVQENHGTNLLACSSPSSMFPSQYAPRQELKPSTFHLFAPTI
eukprot:4444602-Amphidinium_carterae.2